MECKYCHSSWNSSQTVVNCPFCGKMIVEETTEIYDISSALQKVISERGLEILKNNKIVISYIMDFVQGHERDKKLFKILCNNDMLNVGYKLILESNSTQKDISIKKAFKTLTDEAFLSTENAIEALNILLRGLDLDEIDSVTFLGDTNKDSDSSTITSSARNVTCIEYDMITQKQLEEKEKQYFNAQKLADEARKTNSVTKVEQASELFALIDDYKDSKDKVNYCEELKLEILYDKALREKNKAMSYTDATFISQILDRAAAMFMEIKDYQDAEKRAQECKDLKNERIYEIAVKTKETADKYNDETIYSKAVSIFGTIKNYKDSKELSEYCSAQLKLAHKEVLYRRGIVFSKENDAFSLEKAINCFNQIPEWKDSKKLLELCIEKKKKISVKKPSTVIPNNITSTSTDNNSVLWQRKGLCRYCGGEFQKRLFFTTKCKKCGRTKNY